MGIQTFYADGPRARQREVNIQLRLAAAFERRLRPRIVRLINKRVRAAANAFKQLGELGIDIALTGHDEEITFELVAHYRAVMQAFGDRILKAGKKLDRIETKDAPDIFAVKVSQWIEEFAPSAAVGISATTKNQIKQAMKAGTLEGESLEEIADRIVKKTGGYRKGTIPFARAEVIARTETHSASVKAGDEALSAMGLDDIVREWVTVADERARDSHRRANTQRRKQGEMFDVGKAKLEHPGDPRGPAEEIINCRCVLVGVVEEEEAPASNPQEPTESRLNEVMNSKGKNFRTQTSADNWGKRNFSAWKDGLSKKELEAFSDYKEGGFDSAVNGRVRKTGGVIKPGSRIDKKMQIMDAALERSEVPETINVYRGFGTNRFKGKTMVGKAMTDEGFVSTALKRDVAEEFAEAAERGKEMVVMKIKVPKGAKAAYIDELGARGFYADETELILQRKSTFMITKERLTTHPVSGEAVRQVEAILIPKDVWAPIGTV